MSIAEQIGFRPWDGGRPQARGFNLQTRSSAGLGEGSLAQAVTVMAVASLLVPVLVAGVLSAALISMPMSGSLPPLRPAIDSRVTRVYDVSGAPIASLQRFEISVPTTRGDIPPALRQAVVAAEDQRFYSHQGVDSRGIVRALWADIQGNGYRQGGSTITQQYVRLAYADDRRTLGRKVSEAVLARRVEAKLGKDEILYLYLQRAYFGEGAYGVGGAAETYFHKPVNQLTLSEAALLAGLLPAPSRYNPRSNPAEAEVRRMGVLQKMASQALITPRQLAEASAQRLVLADDDDEPSAGPATVVYPPMAQSSPFPWFADYARRYLVARYGEEAVYQGGLRVETSLDPRLAVKGRSFGSQRAEGHPGAVGNGHGGARPPDRSGTGHGRRS